MCGIRIHHFQNVSGHCLESKPEKFKDKKYEMVFANYDKEAPEYWSMTGYTTHGMCGSGYTSASWGHLEYKKLDTPGSLHYIPKSIKELDWNFERDTPSSLLENDIFSYLEQGCSYYPHGKFELQEELEKGYHKTNRLPEKPMLHVFHGASALGKSTLAEMTGKPYHESDAKFDIDDFFFDLPEDLVDNILVLGNKHKETSISKQIETIKERYNDYYTLVFVEFSLKQ